MRDDGVLQKDVRDWSKRPTDVGGWVDGSEVVSPGIWLPGTWRRRSAACLRSWWTCPGWLVSLSASSPCSTALTCWPRPASSCGSPVWSPNRAQCQQHWSRPSRAHCFGKTRALHDNNAIIHTNSSDFGSCQHPAWRAAPSEVSHG